MANISLREYIRKIENLIDNGQIDQAIGHCKHILQIYPKHIDSYRLLGKALLEKQKYGDASDIFQRVLSSVPDDFISHIGMSIIREDENNLDAAIWHMERAFEVQPSNKAVQDELRRLYTSRDGIAPPKIRLTRGALVRMYTRGELYNQAIAEIWSALSEDPNRVDLEVILARIYFLLGQKVEATDTCSKLISKLPYCYEANKILTEILPGTTREEDEKVFRQRVVDMDPYFQFVNEKTLATADVPDSKIMVEHFDWDPSANIDEQPDWAQSIGFALDNESSSGDDFSGWLNNIVSQPKETMDLESDDKTESPALEETQDVAVNLTEPQDERDEIAFPTDDEEEKEIPDWIKDAGWEVSNEEDEDLEKGFPILSILPLEDEILDSKVDSSVGDLNENDTEDEEEIQPAEIPGWLQEIAPSENSIKIPDEVDDFEVKNLEDLFDNLEKDESEFIRSESKISWEKEFTDDKDPSLEDTLQGFDFSSLSLNEDESKTNLESAGELDSAEKPEDELDWIKDLSFDDEPVGNEELPTAHVTENIQDIEKEEEKLDKQSLDQIINELEEIDIEPAPSMDDEWLNSLVIDENKEDLEKGIFIENEKEEIPDWIKSVIDEESEKSPISSVNDEDSLPDWLSISDENLESELDDIKISFDDVKDKSIPVDTSIDVEESPVSNEEKYSNEPLSELVDDELMSAPEELKTEESPLEIEISEEIIGEIKPITDSEEEPVSQIEDQRKEDLVPDLKSYPQQAEKTEELEEEKQPAVENDEDELESALAWMEGLALKQGAAEETLLSKPEERSETPPDWISEASELSQDSQEELDTTPSWLKELEIETGEVQSLDTTQSHEEIFSTEFLDSVEDQEDEISSEMDKYQEKVHDFENLFEELETEGDEKPTASFDQNVVFDDDETSVVLPEKTDGEPLLDEEFSDIETEENFEELTAQIEIDAVESSIEITEQEIENVESEELIPELSIEDDFSLEEDEELSIEYPEDEVVSEEISDIEDRKYEVSADSSSPEDQLVEPIETIQESMIDEQKIVTKFEDEIEDTQPVKVKDNRLNELETANKFLRSGNLEKAINRFDPLIHDGFELETIIENIQNALDHHYPIDINLWQALGDAYLKNNQLQNALDAYSKAEDLLL
ncbi:MAG: tetratricopeptide repeat protein [Anaerolineaceae bacterium]|nr:tetratricopeptide repeat protein [Anaerolineaceae bacterium]